MTAATITRVTLRRLALPLVVPYRLSYRTFEAFEPILVEVEDEAGRTGFGEGHISPGSSAETRDGGWRFCRRMAPTLVGEALQSAGSLLTQACSESPVAASAMLTAVEMLGDHPLLRVSQRVRLPILTPTSATAPAEIEHEVEARLAEGFRTFKVKVGKDVDADLERVRRYQLALAGRASLRLDANRAFDVEQGCRFAASLEPEGIELFEQPCAAEDWDGNARVASCATVPLMLDEPICSIADVDRAAGIAGVRFCKVKLKRFVSLYRLDAVLTRIRERGLIPVLGDGLACEPGCWMEACVARAGIDNAGEFNGFLKPRARLFATPLEFDTGAVVLDATRPELDAEAVERHTVEHLNFDRVARTDG